MTQKIGNYYLTQDINSAYGLEEFSEEEYYIAEQVGMKRIFEDEKMYNGVNAEFAQILWESTTIGTTKGQIYKIALQILSTDDKLRAKLILDTVLKFMNIEIGKYNEHHSHSDKYFWDTKEGNIILDKQSRFNVDSIQIIFTSILISNLITTKIANQLKVNLSQVEQNQKRFSNSNNHYNQNNYSDEENLRWCLLRGNEWGDWPLFVTQPIVPFLLLYFQWWHIIITIIALTWLWALIRYKYVNVFLAKLGAYIDASKWFISIGMGIYFLINGQYFLSIFSSLYPLVLMGIMFLVPPTKIGVLQNMFMNKLGYEKA